jgi:hypothetical protein
MEWERNTILCSTTTKIFMRRSETGSWKLATDDVRWTPERIKAYTPHFIQAMAGIKADEIEENRARYAFYRKPVLLEMTDEQYRSWATKDPAWRRYLNEHSYLLDNEPKFELDAEAPEDGPKEIGLHGDGGDMVIHPNGLLGWTMEHDTRQTTEPSEFALWPLTPYERKHGVLPLDKALARAAQDYAAVWYR